MAGKNSLQVRTYQIEDTDGVAMYTGVTYGSEDGGIAKPSADNAVFVGVVDNDEAIDDGLSATGDQAGKNVAVTTAGYAKVKLSGSIDYGARVILADGGAVKAVPAATEEDAQYNVVGFAEKAGSDGDIIPVKINPHTFNVAASV